MPLLSIFLIIYLLYNLIFKNYFAMPLYVIKGLLIVSITLQTLYLLRAINIYFFIKLNILANNLYQKLYWEPLQYIYTDIIQKIPNLGNNIYFLGKLYVDLSLKLKYHTTIAFSMILYLVPNIILMFFLIYNVLLIVAPNKSIYLLMPLIIVYLRFMTFLIFFLNEFALKNMSALDKLLIIKQVNNAHLYMWNYAAVKNPTKERLNVLSTRYEMFKALEIFTHAVMFFRDHKIKPILKPFMVSIFFTCSLKIFAILFHLVINSGILSIVFLISLLSEFITNGSIKISNKHNA